ncbi:sulfite dehydrogenase [Acidovorax sp. D2M1]|uniref:Sulfite dehydrogenase n=1 Tax=Acidovorax benzenivorans TaxID=2987520 RepID=A0ABT5S1B4_9BURK|nr:sulfite dehydrogenase [Acidovorax benzenivorans]MDD2179745.1 sulfite dehydrogenase [Acidovorax benzenivorans]
MFSNGGPKQLGRREFLGALAVGGASAAGQAAPPLATSLPEPMARPGGADLAYGLPAPEEAHVERALSMTAGFPVWRTPLQRQRGVITPSGLHFAVHHNGVPEIDPRRHVLLLHGLVNQPLRFDLERLLRYPMVSRVHFLECAGNSAANALSPTALDQTLGEIAGEVSCSEWTGVPLSYLLREAGLKDTAQWVVAEGADGGSHSRSLPLKALLEDGMVALFQNGERLRPSQGYPMRLFMPGWEGNVNIKWLHRLEVTDAPAYTKDESGLYTQVLADGGIERFAFHMEVKSVITHPSGQQRLHEPHGFYEISGLAWSGRGRIARVDVSVDGGRSWTPAQLHAPVLDRAFTRFTLPWQWRGHRAELMSRATDEQGRTQPLRSEWKRRYAMHSFNHYNAVQAWRVQVDGRVENLYA